MPPDVTSLRTPAPSGDRPVHEQLTGATDPEPAGTEYWYRHRTAVRAVGTNG